MSEARPLLIGDSELDLNARLLTRRGMPVRLSPKAFALLAALVRARPRALSKAELQDLIWPGTFVVEANLANLVSEVRRALEDDPTHPRLLRTVYGHGYAWQGECATLAQHCAPAGVYWLFVGRTPFALREGDHVLGRAHECSVLLPSDFVSRHHARLSLRGEHAVITDLGSRNGTYVCGRRIAGPATLRSHDEIRIGPYYLSIAMPFTPTPTTRPGGSGARSHSQSRRRRSPRRTLGVP